MVFSASKPTSSPNPFSARLKAPFELDISHITRLWARRARLKLSLSAIGECKWFGLRGHPPVQRRLGLSLAS
jgi:hypothetical protein